MNVTLMRLRALLLGWGLVGVVYTLSDLLQRAGHKLPPFWIDERIAFSPSAVWLYLSFFFIVPLGYFLTPEGRVRWLMRATGLAALMAGAVYLAWPTTMDYPPVVGDGASVAALHLLLAVDSTQNCFPSLHMALTLLMVWGVSQRRQWFLTALFIIWGVAIGFSILQLRRHLFVDLAGGTALALLAGWLAGKMETYPLTRKELRRE